MESGYAPVDNGQLYYETVGSGEPLILIHGFSLDHRMWQTQVEFLSRTYRVFSYDLRGFGKSSNVSGEYKHHDDLVKLFEHLKIKSAHIIGLSLGGEIALNFTLEYPNLVKKLVLADSSLGGYKSTVDWNVYAQEFGVEKAKENWLNHQVFRTSCQNIQVKQELEKIVSDYSGWHWLNSDYKLSPQPKAIDRLNEISVPTLIITGKKDLDYFQSIAKILSTQIRNSQQVSIPNAGHMVNMEKPEEFNKTVSEFFKK